MKHRGTATGTYIVNHIYKYTNSPVPLESLLDHDLVDEITTIKVYDSIATIANVLLGEDKENIGKVIPTSLCHLISKRDLQIAGMSVKLSSTHLDGIVSVVKSKLVDVIMELERKYSNLDELDIKEQVDEDYSKKEQVVYNIEQIIYEGSIEIGDKNKIGKSKIGHWFGGRKE
ncbi:hypothetical protein [Paenibacillus elgii]|uniref:AbiTii domain-containing protein n=1 Tax=Paenibacillus elgii TaxID=189691 RepID=UPI000248C6BD|nr:hypothetical protein [Paenibacillus elgii]